MIRCSQCHHQNDSDLAQCERCGFDFDSSTGSSTQFGVRSPFAGDADPAVTKGELHPMKTSFGIHVLDDDGALALGDLSEPPPSSTNTMMGRSLGSTVQGLKVGSNAESTGDSHWNSPAGDTAFGVPAPVLEARPGRPASTNTMVGRHEGFRAPNPGAVGMPALSEDPHAVPPTTVLGDIGDEWIDEAFGAIASQPVGQLPELVQPEVAAAPGFGIMRKKRVKRGGDRTSTKPVTSAGSYENRRAEPEHVRVPSDSLSESSPVARIATPAHISDVAFANTQAMSALTSPPESSASGTLTLDVREFGGEDFAPSAAPRDRLSPISVKAVNASDRLKPLPVRGGLPRASVETPGVGSPAIGGTMVLSPAAMAGVSAAELGVAQQSGGAAGDMQASPVNYSADGGDSGQPPYTADGAFFDPGARDADSQAEASSDEGRPFDQTMGFSPSLDLNAAPIRGFTPPSDGATLQLDSGTIDDFLAAAAAVSSPPSEGGDAAPIRGFTAPSGNATVQLDTSTVDDLLATAAEAANASAAAPFEKSPEPPVRATSVSISADVALDRLRPPAHSKTDSDDLLSLSANSGLSRINAPSRTSANERAAKPPHISDARRTPPGAARQIAIVVSVVVLLAALSVLGVLIYQEFTAGASGAVTTSEEGSG